MAWNGILNARAAVKLYETDFARWAEEQAHALRDAAGSGTNLPLDWLNLAEDVEGLARSDRRAPRSRIETILEHIFKLAYAPSTDRRNGWRIPFDGSATKRRLLLEDNRSLRTAVGRLVETYSAGVASRVADDLRERGEITDLLAADLRSECLDPTQVLGDWFPPEPS